MLPYAGGSGYLGCYADLSHEEKLKERNRIFDMRMKLFIDTIHDIAPRKVMPFADQYVIGVKRGYLNKYSPHAPSPGYVKDYLVAAGLDKKLVLLNSGQSYDLDADSKNPDLPYYVHTAAEQEAYIRELETQEYDHDKVEMRDNVPI